jgi:short-subunit dehydrogenase
LNQRLHHRKAQREPILDRGQGLSNSYSTQLPEQGLQLLLFAREAKGLEELSAGKLKAQTCANAIFHQLRIVSAFATIIQNIRKASQETPVTGVI